MAFDRRSELLLRVYLVFFAFMLVALLIIGKVVKISLFEGSKFRELGGRNVKWVEVKGERGNIYDIRGNLLATSLPFFDIYVDLVTSSDELFDNNIDALVVNLAKHFGKTPTEWKKELVSERIAGKNNKPGSRYYPLMKRVSKEQLDLLRKFPIFKEGRYKGGLQWERKTTREKPYKSLCSRTIGLDRENASRIGLERTYNKVLEGEKQKRLLRRFPGDQWLPVFDPADNTQRRGGDIVTTLDMRIQDIAHHELLGVVEKYEAEAGTAIVMEVKTGAVKAIVNLGRDDSGFYSEKYNYAVGRLSEPGSTFKLMSSLAMLQNNKVTLDSKIQVNKGRKKFYDRWMRDSEPHGENVMSFQRAFELSSNVGLANAAFTSYGKDRTTWNMFYEDLRNLGVMDKTGIEIAGEPSPFFKNPNNKTKDGGLRWSGTTVPWMAHGYEMKMTPLQILNVYNAIANDGALMRPFITSEIITKDGDVKKIKPKILKQNIIDPDAVIEAQKLLKGVAESGTARKLKIKNTSFAGKTGTTRINYWKNLDHKEYNASFAGYFPEEDPKYSVIVVVYNPKGAYYGSQVAGPVFAKIVDRVSGIEERVMPEFVEGRKVVKAHSGFKSDYTRVLDYIGIPYESDQESNWVNMSSEADAVEIEPKKIKLKTVPDLKGMGLRDAVYVLESLGMKVEIEGVGQVYKQSIKSGSKVSDKPIKIYLR